MLNIVFMGTPDFAKESLESVYNAKHNILAVVTNPDKPKGRGMKMIPSPVKEYAIEKNIPVYQPLKVRNNTEFIEEIKLLKPDVICVVAYGKILPKEILDIPRLGCINVHGSILPKYRGAAPIQWAVINGESKTGITTMYMDIGMDTGDMILKEEVSIGENETTGELWERLSNLGGKLLVKTLSLIEDGKAPREKQPDDFTLAPMLNKEMALINWEEKTAIEIKNLVRGLNPIMGAYTYINDKKLKIWKVQIMENLDFITKYKLNNSVGVNLNSEEITEMIKKIENVRNGEILLANEKQGLFFKTKDGILEAIEIQPENSKKMLAKDYLRGNRL